MNQWEGVFHAAPLRLEKQYLSEGYRMIVGVAKTQGRGRIESPVRRRGLTGPLTGLLLGMLLSACGGGGGGSGAAPVPAPPPVPQTVTISGTVAAGAALTGTVSVYDSSTNPQPRIANTTIGAGGQYSATVTGFTAPFFLVATGQVEEQGPTGSLYAVATAAGIANITPITTLMALNMGAGDVQSLMTGASGVLPSLTATDLNDQNANMDALLAAVLATEGLSTNYNFTTTTFAVDGTGYSKLLNTVAFGFSAPAAVLVVNITDPLTQIIIDTQTGNPSGPLDVVSGPPALPSVVTVGGKVTGLSGSGLQLQDNGGETLAVAANATTFTFVLGVASGSAYSVNVQTQPSGQICVVSNGSGTAATANVVSVTVACSAIAANTNTIGGTIGGLTGSGLQLLDNGGDTISIASNATTFTFPTTVASGAAYAVTVKTQPSGQSCSVSNGTGTATANVTNVTLKCATTPANTYTVSGTISGLTSAPLVLELNGAEDLTFGAGATTFSFATPLKPSSTYQITVKTTPVGQVTCSVANGSGTITSANIVNVAVSCAPFYTFHGTVSNLNGVTLSLLLQNNGGYSSNRISLLPGQSTFDFNVGLFNGTGYDVTVQQQPSGQSCTVANGSGTVSGSNVSSISVSCATVPQWAWISGDDSSLLAVYGSLGHAAAGNSPGGRGRSATWVDAAGNLWLFGGASSDGSPTNDLWMYSQSTGLWTWEGGSSSSYAAGVYGTKGVAASGNVPGARYGAVAWTDTTGNFWLFGGQGFDSTRTQGWLNDLWKYSPSTGQWVWVSGSSFGNASGVYGTAGVEATTNQPGGRLSAMGWIDSANNLWLLGGAAIDANGIQTTLNDLWKFDTNAGQWTWFCTSLCSLSGVYGEQGVPDAANGPGARQGGATWIDSAGQLWLFGGIGKDSAGTVDALNDLWRYSPMSGFWTWMGGSTAVDARGVYGVQGVATATNLPGARYQATTWIDLSDSFWLFGGEGYDSSNFGANIQNDVWKYDPASGQWTWMAGANAEGGGVAGLYQTQGLPGAVNLPGARAMAMSWTDASGVWLYGGAAASPTTPGATSYVIEQIGANDLWHLGPGTLFNGTGSMAGTFTDQNGCKYPAPATITNANVTMSTENAGAVAITYTVPALTSSAATCPNYGANSGSFSVPVTVNGSVMLSLAGSIGTVSATISGGVVSGTVGFQETGTQGSGTFSWTESGSFSTVAVPVTVPSLAGMTEAAAASAVTAAGLQIGTVTYQNSATVSSGSVLSQTPAAGVSANTGSAVNLVVSSGGAPNAIVSAPVLVSGYAPVLLDGSASVDQVSPIKSYTWTQIAGPPVTLTSANNAIASFTAPQVTTQTAFSFVLTVTDATGTTSSSTATVIVNPATAAQLSIAIVSASLYVPDTTSLHTQFDGVDGPPLAGSTNYTFRIAMSGALQSPAFALIDAAGNVLSKFSATPLGSQSTQPLVFMGPITVPTVPFQVAASGISSDGQSYSVQSGSLMTPMLMTVNFDPSILQVPVGMSGTSQLTIYNGGSAAQFNIAFSDPNGLLAGTAPTSVQIGASSSATIPITVSYPGSPANMIGPTITASVSVTGDPTRSGTVTLTLWQVSQ
jgi:N-acetylneuraminic acid mutarotase